MNLCFIIIIILFFAEHASSIDNEYIIKLDRGGICGKGTGDLIKVYNWSLEFSPNVGQIVNAVWEYTRDVDVDSLWANVSLTRCASKEALDTCEFYRNFNPPPIKACGLLETPAVRFSGIYTKVKPPFRCPLKKGIYVATDLSFNVNILKKVYPDLFNFARSYYWKGKTYSYEKNEFFGSLCGEGALVKWRH